MKNILVTLAVALAPACLFAQALPFTPDAGFQTDSLFSLNIPVGGFDYNSSGDIYYIGGAQHADTEVVEATKASGYSAFTPIVDYGTFTYGSFVAVDGSKVYYGDSVEGTNGPGNINVSGTTVITPTPGPTPLANMPGNYDLVFSGTNAFVSANIGGAVSFDPDNEVDYLNTSTGKYQDILNTNDYSGPVTVTSSGELIYGESGYSTPAGGIYIFSKASVQNAITTGTALTLADAVKVIPNSGNGAFALGPGNELFSASASTVTMYDLTTGDATTMGSVANDEVDYIAAIGYDDGVLTVAETDGYTTTPAFSDFFEITAIPEPGAVPLAMAGLVVTFALRRKR